MFQNNPTKVMHIHQMCKVNMQNAIKSKERAAKRGYKVCTSTSKTQPETPVESLIANLIGLYVIKIVELKTFIDVKY